jgi:hypothetical protein
VAKQEERDKSVRFISKLVQLTQDRKVKWEAVTAPPNSEAAFATDIEGRKLRIFRYSERIPNPDYAAYTSPGLTLGSTLTTLSILGTTKPAPPETVIRSGTILQIIDAQGRSVYKFENRTGLSDLYESASYSAAKVDELMDTILGKDWFLAMCDCGMSKRTIFTISAIWDHEASVWSGHCDDIPSATDAPSLDELLAKISAMALDVFPDNHPDADLG